MIKYSVLLFFLGTVLLLGYTGAQNNFFGPRRDPVPDQQIVAHSIHCAGCHGRDQTGLALVDGEGNDVSIHDDWQISMMGLSAHDPFWRATLTHEAHIYGDAKAAIEQSCLKCHAPLGSIQSHHAGLAYSFAAMLHDSLGLDGVSCSACHQQSSDRLGQHHSGDLELDTNRIMFGPYPNPVQGPMQIYVGFEPRFSEHIYSSGICAGCHTLITETLNDDGIPTGNYFVEQATYHEWLNSIYPAQGKECQSCHLPFIEDSVVIATDLLALEKRYPYGLHQFFGANTAMLTMMKNHRQELGLPPAPEDAWEESIKNNRQSLRSASALEVQSMQVIDDTLLVRIMITNKAGHKLPSGYPSRVAWIEVTLADPVTSEIIYANGIMEEDGEIAHRNFPFEPHHEVSYSEQDVQIYEMAMAGIDGGLTTRLNGAHHPLKDNRILPAGFSRSNAVYDTVAVWGNALDDPQYNAESHFGRDEIEYRIPLRGRKGFADMQVRFNYHTFPARWMKDLFKSDTLAYVNSFKTMYNGFEKYYEVMDSVLIENISLSPTATREIEKGFDLMMFPNPVHDNVINLRFEAPVAGGCMVQMVDMQGKVVAEQPLQPAFNVPEQLRPGVYYIIVRKDNQVVSINAFTLL